MMKINEDTVVAVVGLGYVGLPLAIEFGKKFKTIGYDLSKAKIDSYRKFIDPTGEISTDELKASKNLLVSTDPAGIKEADFVIVAVPTPVDAAHVPDFSPLLNSSATVGQFLKKGAIVIYESTVYPGATEDICIPILEKNSGMRWKKDFNVGYSPERVNPGDPERTITKIVKVVSGDIPKTLNSVSDLYSSVIEVGVHRAPSIKVAEAAKVIENTQRDLNIALVNELSIIFNKIGIDTIDVLEAAGTKWNFLPFRPGLVGGHCIGVDPYYLTHKAEILGYHPQVILAGRRINDGMASYVAQQIVKNLIVSNKSVNKAKISVLGLTFKENCADLRNSKVADLVKELKSFGCDVICHDPIANAEEALNEYGINLVKFEDLPASDAIVLAVAHRQYIEIGQSDLLLKLNHNGIFVDIKSTFSKDESNISFKHWRL